MRGIVSAMSISSDSMLAAGTFSGAVGLYDHEGSGSTIAVFELGERGGGVTSLKWSASGQYLYVVQRRCSEILVYDVRKVNGLVATLKGFHGETNQRIGVDVRENGECWGGGTDGVVRVWDMETKDEPVREWKAHEGTVSATAIHPSASVVATCSGHRTYAPLQEHEGEGLELASDPETAPNIDLLTSDPENSLKIWRI